MSSPICQHIHFEILHEHVMIGTDGRQKNIQLAHKQPFLSYHWEYSELIYLSAHLPTCMLQYENHFAWPGFVEWFLHENISNVLIEYVDFHGTGRSRVRENQYQVCQLRVARPRLAHSLSTILENFKGWPLWRFIFSRAKTQEKFGTSLWKPQVDPRTI